MSDHRDSLALRHLVQCCASHNYLFKILKLVKGKDKKRKAEQIEYLKSSGGSLFD